MFRLLRPVSRLTAAGRASKAGRKLKEAKRLKELEVRHARLKMLLAEPQLDKAVLKEFASRNW